MIATMQAFMLTDYGPEATIVCEIPRPEPGPDEILVHVHAAGLNPVDFKTREGIMKIVQRYPLPITMGNELVGVVETSPKAGTQFRSW